MFDIDVLLNRLDQLESKNEQQEIKVAELEVKVVEHAAMVSLVKSQCGIMNNCVERSYKCNADSLAPLELVDEGKYS